MVGVIDLLGKKHLLKETRALFIVSATITIALWLFFLYQRNLQDKRHIDMRYISVISALRGHYKHNNITKEVLKELGLKRCDKNIPTHAKVLLKRGREHFGFVVYQVKDKNILCTKTPQAKNCYLDLRARESFWLLHLTFLSLLVVQILMFLRINKALIPLSLVQTKLQKIQSGDMSLLDVESNYLEIQQVVNAYNQSISQINYMLNTKEMFNKIFMHEMKTPIAKGMFYLKLEPSEQTHKKISNLFATINKELDEFSTVEKLISQKNQISKTKNKLIDLVKEALFRLGIGDENISLDLNKTCEIVGDKELWVLCFKNLIDNALKYAKDKRLDLSCKNGTTIFANKGDDLPVDINADIQNWKIDKTKRHKSSTGYGFGLFIIKNIVLINGYKLKHRYQNETNYIEICI